MAIVSGDQKLIRQQGRAHPESGVALRDVGEAMLLLVIEQAVFLHQLPPNLNGGFGGEYEPTELRVFRDERQRKHVLIVRDEDGVDFAQIH